MTEKWRDERADMKEMIEGAVAQLRADPDMGEAEKVAFFEWLVAYTQLQLAEVKLEAFNG